MKGKNKTLAMLYRKTLCVLRHKMCRQLCRSIAVLSAQAEFGIMVP